MGLKVQKFVKILRPEVVILGTQKGLRLTSVPMQPMVVFAVDEQHRAGGSGSESSGDYGAIATHCSQPAIDNAGPIERLCARVVVDRDIQKTRQGRSHRVLFVKDRDLNTTGLNGCCLLFHVIVI